MSINILELDEIFRYYGIYANINTSFDTINLTSNGSSGVAGFGTGCISVDFDIHSIETFYRFINDLKHGRDSDVEEKLRDENATLQRAYEEYQLLLKLLK